MDANQLIQDHREDVLYANIDGLVPSQGDTLPSPDTIDLSDGLALLSIQDPAEFQRHLQATKLCQLVPPAAAAAGAPVVRVVSEKAAAFPDYLPPPAAGAHRQSVGGDNFYNSAVVSENDLHSELMAEACCESRKDGTTFWSRRVKIVDNDVKMRELELTLVGETNRAVNKFFEDNFFFSQLDFPGNQAAWQAFKKAWKANPMFRGLNSCNPKNETKTVGDTNVHICVPCWKKENVTKMKTWDATTARKGWNQVVRVASKVRRENYSDGTFAMGAQVTDVYFHDSECALPPEKRRQRFSSIENCGSGCFKLKFDSAVMLGNSNNNPYAHEITFDMITRNQETPPLFVPATNGVPGYDLDNRKILRVPVHDTNHTYFPQQQMVEAHHERHKKLLRRLSLLVSNAFNCGMQFSRDQSQLSWYDSPAEHCGSGPPPHLSMDECYISILGETKEGIGSTHQRAYCTHAGDFMPDLHPSGERFTPGTLVIPLRCQSPIGKPMYIHHPDVQKCAIHCGELLYIPANVPRGEINLHNFQEHMFNPTLFVEIRSTFQGLQQKRITYDVPSTAYIPRAIYPYLPRESRMDLFDSHITEALALAMVDDKALNAELAGDYAVKFAAIKHQFSTPRLQPEQDEDGGTLC